MTTRRASAEVQIALVPGTARKLPAADRRKIEQVVRERLLSQAKEPYHKVQVEVERSLDGSPRALLVSMLRARTYTADVFRVSVDAHYKVTSVEDLSSGGGQ
jgi:hypothetical protein